MTTRKRRNLSEMLDSYQESDLSGDITPDGNDGASEDIAEVEVEVEVEVTESANQEVGTTPKRTVRVLKLNNSPKGQRQRNTPKFSPLK
jgi:hypothetical protein